MNELQHLMRVTGMGRLAAEAHLKSCDKQEVDLLKEGRVQDSLNLHADRHELARKQARAVVQESPSPAGKRAAKPSGAVSEAASGHDTSGSP